MFGTIVTEAIALLLKHWDVIDLVITALEQQKLPKDAVMLALKQAMIAASDAEIDREYPVT